MPAIGDHFLPDVLKPKARRVEFRFRVEVDPKGGLFASPVFVYAGSMDEVDGKLDTRYGIMRDLVVVKSILMEAAA